MGATHLKGPLVVGGVEVISATGEITGDIVATAGSIGTTELANNAITAVKINADAVTTAKILDGAVTAAKLASAMSAIETVAVALTNSQIKGLVAAPKTLVAAGGAGTVIQFLGAVLALDYGSEVLTESADDLVIRYGNTTGAIVSETIDATGFIDAAADTMTNAIPKKDAIVANTGAVAKALVLHNLSGDFAGNASNNTTMKVYVTYRTITL